MFFSGQMPEFPQGNVSSFPVAAQANLTTKKALEQTVATRQCLSSPPTSCWAETEVL